MRLRFLQVDPGGTALKIALLEYARARAVEPVTDYVPEKVQQVIENSTLAKAALWPALKKFLEQKTPGAMEASLTVAVNEVIDLHSTRIKAVFDKLPPTVLVLVIFISAASFAVAGFNAGIRGKISRWRMFIFALMLTGVVMVIQDYDRPLKGFIVVSHESILSERKEMEENLAIP